MASFSDGVVLLTEGREKQWTQEQGLAAIEQAMFIDLPAPSRELAAAISESAPTLKDRLNREWISIKVRSRCPCVHPAKPVLGHTGPSR